MSKERTPMSSKIGRNDPCRCGSGKKYKKCCLPNDEAARLTGVAQVADRGTSVGGQEACFLCGKPVNLAGVRGQGGEDVEPNGLIVNLGAHSRKATVCNECFPKFEPLMPKARQTYHTPKGEFGEWTWCLHCERVHRTEKWVANDWQCPSPGCDGTLLDAHDFENPSGWPTVSYISGGYPNRYVYLENPTDGGYYPLHPQWQNEDALLLIGTRGRWVDRTWVPEHPIEYKRIELPDGGSVEGDVQIRQCQVCGQERYCTLGGCWDCRRITCIECEGGFGKCKECSER